jgi:hypothetical protein
MAKRGGGGKKTDEKPTPPKAPPHRLPAREAVVCERTFISPKGKRYRVLRTTEKDAYDPPDDEDKSGPRRP